MYCSVQDKKLSMSHLWMALAAKKANHLLDCISKTEASCHRLAP